jgi:hypothetical protein
MREEDRYIASKDFCAKAAGEQFCSKFREGDRYIPIDFPQKLARHYCPISGEQFSGWG